ncbi:MAG TPA: cytochrome P450, partial [Chthoniobacterales bacterium]|nr:cytochrome P450 [Chthoniobacterales bacterium]
DVLEQGVFFALQRAKYVANPYPLYHRLRAEAPFHWDFVLGGWFLTRYDDVRAALGDPRLSTKNFSFDVSQLPTALQKNLAAFGRVKETDVLYNDSPEHDRLRRPLNRAFNPAVFIGMLPKIEALAQELLAKAVRRRLMDVAGDYAEPLANYMISELLGLPSAIRQEFIEWCDQLTEFTTAQRVGSETVLTAQKAVNSFARVRALIRRMIAARRENFVDDVIGRTLSVEPNEATLSEDEVLANCVFFLHAGVRNMAAAITNAVLVLLQHPEQLIHLRKNPQSLSVAVEELLRYETPVQVAIRGVPEEIEFAGQRIGPQQLLVLLLGAANRDPGQFREPDRLDLTRRPNHHVSFGFGAHGCVGAWMARFGLTIAIRAILDHQTTLRFATNRVQWNPAPIGRTVRKLVVSLDGRSRNGSRLPTLVPAQNPLRVARTPIPAY